jgi:hypothetical protein
VRSFADKFGGMENGTITGWGQKKVRDLRKHSRRQLHHFTAAPD